MKSTTEFSMKVIALIKKIPRGKVATYGQIAELAGKPHGARGVAWILHSCSESHDLPWQRVLNSKGKISFPPSTRNYRQQKKLLKDEGVEFFEGDQINLKKSQWKKSSPTKKSTRVTPKMFG